MWTVFADLRASRVDGRIPASEIEAYCRLANINNDAQRIRIFRFVTALDNVEAENADIRSKT